MTVSVELKATVADLLGKIHETPPVVLLLARLLLSTTISCIAMPFIAGTGLMQWQAERAHHDYLDFTKQHRFMMNGVGCERIGLTPAEQPCR